jgi:hypothetical protein
MTEMHLNRAELQAILKVLDDMKHPDVYAVKIGYDNSSGIGSIVTVTLPTTVNGVEGEFTTTISDESDW